jgi:type VI secretion system protein VasG
LPDKAVSLLDTACARVAISQHAQPPPVEQSRRAIAALEKEQEIRRREASVGVDHAKRLAQISLALEQERRVLSDLEKKWGEEKQKVGEILQTRSELLKPGVESEPLRLKLAALETDLKNLQGDTALVLDCVTEGAVAAVLADWTGIPVGRMVKNEIQAVLHLVDTLESRIIGQRHALETVARRIQTARAGFDNPSKPVGVFLLAGPSGVGKTETALALAEALYGGEQNAIVINMSEFQEKHTVSTLKGAPPGYVGYGEGGVLTEAVRRRPYSIVLLDEVEKAHKDVHEIFFQVFDKGWMEDGEGRHIDFKNTIIILTTNAGSGLLQELCKDPQTLPEPEGLAKALRPPLLEVFPPALLGRLVVVPYYPLNDAVLKQIIRLQLGRIVRRVSGARGIELSYADAVVDLIQARCTEVESGGRMVDAILTQNVLPELSREVLGRMMEGRQLSSVKIGVDGSNFTFQFD